MQVKTFFFNWGAIFWPNNFVWGTIRLFPIDFICTHRGNLVMPNPVVTVRVQCVCMLPNEVASLCTLKKRAFIVFQAGRQGKEKREKEGPFLESKGSPVLSTPFALFVCCPIVVTYNCLCVCVCVAVGNGNGKPRSPSVSRKSVYFEMLVHF